MLGETEPEPMRDDCRSLLYLCPLTSPYPILYLVLGVSRLETVRSLVLSEDFSPTGGFLSHRRISLPQPV
jgi:hypothetical protein